MAVAASAPAFRKLGHLKDNFFDRGKVMRAVDRATRKNLNWLGGYVRKVARNSLKAKAGISSPGSPPFTHRTYKRTHVVKKKQRVQLPKPQTRSSFKDSVLYAFQPGDNPSVVIGPFLFNGSRRSPTVPHLLEYGGEVAGNGQTVWISNRGTGRRDARGRFMISGGRFVKMVGAMHYRPRPFMRPALAVSIPKFMSRLKDSVK